MFKSSVLSHNLQVFHVMVFPISSLGHSIFHVRSSIGGQVFDIGFLKCRFLHVANLIPDTGDNDAKSNEDARIGF